MKADTESREKPLVLIADDDILIRSLARESLGQFGFAVEEVEDGLQALSAFEKLHPDVVLLDIIMPGLDGFAVSAALRELPEGEDVPVLMVTGLNDIDSINRAYEAGATDFITKPINWVILAHRVHYMWLASVTGNELQESKEENQALISTIPDLLLQVSRDGIILNCKVPRDFNRELSPRNFYGKTIEEALCMEKGQSAMRYIELALQNGETQILEHHAKWDSTIRYYESRIVAKGKEEVLVIVRDMTERKQAEEKISHLVYHDALTGLLNRDSFRENLRQRVAYAIRHNRLAAILFLDLDRFKYVNDSCGHWLGDMLLKAVALRLVECLRKSERMGDIRTYRLPDVIARLGGDEFSVFLTEIRNVQEAVKVAKQVLDEVSKPFNIAGQEVSITASMGIAVCPFDGDDADTLLKNVDMAMYHAKDQGRNNFQFYTKSMNTAALERLDLEKKLHKALRHGEFLLHYQPQLDIRTGKVVGAESLIRWQHPYKGLVLPMEFIHVAEETGLIIPIGEWVLRTACEQSKKWQYAGFEPMRVTVNLSSHQFKQKDLVRLVCSMLENTGLDPIRLELELTESAIMQNPDETAAMLRELKSLGIQISIDDFGTGYSSLSYLKRFPLDVLKIDRSFVKDIPSDSDSASITSTIIAMAHNLDLKVIAEGVETEQQLAFLREHGCDEMQGFLLSPPVSPHAFTWFLEEGKGLHAEQP